MGTFPGVYARGFFIWPPRHPPAGWRFIALPGPEQAGRFCPPARPEMAGGSLLEVEVVDGKQI
jgi:hypothetical protein